MRVKKRALLDDRVSGEFASRTRRIRPRLIIGATFLIAIPLVATTFASQVTIKGAQGGAIEFGQGNQKTIVCDQYIQTSVGESWNTSPTPDFYVNKIILTNLDVNSLNLNSTTSNQGCGSKNLKVGLYDTSDSPLAIGDHSTTLVSFLVPTTDQVVSPLVGNGTDSHNITAELVNASNPVTAVTSKTETTVTYTYSPSADYPIKIDDWVTISGTPNCNYAGAHVSDKGATFFKIDGISTTGNGCSTGSGLEAKVYGKGVLSINLAGTSTQLSATSVGRISLESN
jgi:hypothetical protein